MAEGNHDRLVDRIVAGRGTVVLFAPPGFHKSRLAQAAAQKIAANSGYPIRLFGLLEHEANPRAAADAVLTDARQVIVIDDVDAADGRWLGLALERTSSSNSGQRVIVSMSQVGDFPLSRMDARQAIDVLDANALRLRPQEIAEVTQAMIPAKSRGRIRDLAGNWPIALDLLCAWSASTRGHCEGLSDLDIVRESRLGDFIAQDILPLLAPEELTALVHASMLETVDTDILSGIAGQRSDGQIIAEIAFRLRGLVDRHGGQFQLQRAMRIWLRDAVAVSDGRSRADGLVVMADRCSAKGRLGEAAVLARMAGDSARIRTYAREHGALRIWIVHGFSVLKCLLDNSSADDIAESAVLKMIECIVHLKSGRIHVAQDLFETLARDMGATHPLSVDVELVRVTLLVYGCSLERTGDLELLKRIIGEQADDAAMRTFLATLSAILNCQRARFDTAIANLIDARAHAEKAGSRYNLMFLQMHEASINLAQGRLKQARTCVTDARRRWQQEFAHDVGVETVIAALNASIEFESGQLSSARNSLRKSANRMPEAEAWFDIYFAAYEVMIRVNIADHGIGPAIVAVEDEARKLRAQGLPRVGDLIVALGLCAAGEARLHGADVATPAHWTIPRAGATASWQELEVFTIARAYACYFDQNIAEAWALLDEAISEAEARGLQRSRLRYLLVMFALASAEGETSRANTALRAAVVIGTASGMRQIFREIAGRRFAPMIRALIDDDTLSEAERGFVARLVNRLQERDSIASGKLSRREIEVLRTLEAGGSDKQLARQLGLSEHGVRFHLKNIFKKMGVHDRASAVAAARKLDLDADTSTFR
ncbi:LuxR C-terminal-related transcriptional regulator [Sphingopyxis sp. 113P3]|uniref:LuxR C-terminal-related transcriptional regulator n=1 Tax=Sphingopyxis sp. (strain 113P3) TaxID=292913 RepID=UPI001F3346B9|nr:LuxR C-terminal-related transcriptional regulator [Sphingopyxis sp. 113P3]